MWFLYSGFLPNPEAHRGSEVFKGVRCEFLRSESLLTAENPTGYPNKNSYNLNIASAQGMMGIVPLALSFSFTPASLRHKESSAEERGSELSWHPS